MAILADQASSPERRLAALGLVLPPARPPVGAFAPARQQGSLLFLSGQGPVTPEGVRSSGRLGAGITIEQASRDARLTTMNLLGVLRRHAGSLDRVRRVVRVLGMVNADPHFTDLGDVLSGCTDLLVAVFGEAAGRPAGTIVGNGSLPSQITVEIELVASLKEEDTDVG